MSGRRITKEWRGILVERRGGLEKNGGVLGHAPTVSNKGRKHENLFSQMAIYGGEEKGEEP